MRRVICTVSANKSIITAETSTRDRISDLVEREAKLKERLADPNLDEDEKVDLGMELHEVQEQLNFAWQDDEAEYNYALEQQEFNPDGSLKGYGDVYGSEDIVDDHEGADLYVIKISHDGEEETIQTWATSPDEAMDYAKNAWTGSIDDIEIVDINPENNDDNNPVFASGDADKDTHISQCSFDYINVQNPEDFRTQRLSRIVESAFIDAGVEPLGVDFRSVDYSMYKEYDGKHVGQCGVDFKWSGTYHEEEIEEELALALDWAGYELVGISFESMEY